MCPPGLLALLLACAASLAAGASAAPAPRPAAAPRAVAEGPPHALLNELDADQAGQDTGEFIEILVSEPGPSLIDCLLVLYNGATEGDLVYRAIDLSAAMVDGDGILVVGAQDVPGVDLPALGISELQNGPDAVALWWSPGVPSSAWVGTSVTAPPDGRAVLLDALVHSVGSQPDASLLEHLAPLAAWGDEGSGGNATGHSLGRQPDGTGRWVAAPPSPGTRNGAPLVAAIHQIQGAGHASPLEGAFVSEVDGVVTSVHTDGFTLQQRPGTEDGDPATSEALAVHTGPGSRPQVGDRVVVSGWVEEHRPGNATTNLPVTRLVAMGGWRRVARDQGLPEPTLIGAGGRLPPTTIIDDDTEGGHVIEGRSVFDPARDGLDFWESLESMRLRLRDPVAVGPTSKFGEIPVVAARGTEAGPWSRRGALVRSSDDPNPERLLLDDALVPLPQLEVGSSLAGDVVGVLTYSFGNPKLLPITAPLLRHKELPPERLPPPGEDLLRIASYNVENLAATSPVERMAALARHVVDHLGSPHILALQEIQDDDGPIDQGTTSATMTLHHLANAIAWAGGPDYTAVEIAPEDGADGGQPGGNIRVAVLHREDSGLRFVERAGGDAVTPVQVVPAADGAAALSLSPGRIAPQHPAWQGSRKPLVLEYRWDGRPLFLVNAHLRSKGGDHPLYGPFQPPVLASEPQRQVQATVIHDFVGEVLALDADARVVVLGDLNDFEDSPPLAALEGRDDLLIDLWSRVAATERYSYIYQGNAQVLDHVLVTSALVDHVVDFRPVHLNAEYVDRPSDHDPVVVDLIPGPPPADGDG